MNYRNAVKAYIIHENQILRMLDLLSFYICIHISFTLAKNVFMGAVTFMVGFGAENFYRIYLRQEYFKSKRILLPMFFILSIGLPLVGVLATPMQIRDLLVILAAVALFTLRSALTHRIVLQFHNERGPCIRSMAVVQLLALAAISLLLGLTVDWVYSLIITAVAAVYPIFVFLWLYRSRHRELVIRASFAAGSAASFRLYHALLLSSYIALYLSMMLYAGNFIFMPLPGGHIPPVVLWIVLVSIISLVGGLLVRRGIIRKMEKTTIFLIGGTICLLAHSQLSQGYTQFNPAMVWFWSMMQAVGLAVMLLLATYMQEDMRLLLVLTEDADETSDQSYRSMTQIVAFVIAGILICIEMYFLNYVISSDLPEWDINVLRGRFMWLANILPLIFIFLSIISALRQPLNLDGVRKLKLYCQQKLSRTIIPEFENKLKNLLVKRYRKRIGIRIVAAFLRPWSYHKVIGTEKVRLSDEPVIFVANHGEVFGPIVTYCHMPYPFRPWIEHRMLDREKITEYLWVNTFSKVRPVWLGKTLKNLAGPFLSWLLNQAEPIPVYRGEVRSLLKTLDSSVLALQEQDNLLLFPEDPTQSADGHYALNGVSPFYTGFVSVAKFYYRKTGKAITFYPVYLNQEKRTMSFGEGVQYDPQGKNESNRISNMLMARMNQMAGMSQ